MNSKSLRSTVILMMTLLAAGLLAGCSNQATNLDLNEEIQIREDKISNLESEMKNHQNDLAATERRLQDAEERARRAEADAQNSNTTVISTSTESDLLPPSAQAGECYARVVIPPVYETNMEEILVSEASERIEIIPAKFEWVEEKVLVQEASEKIITVPAVYEWTEERMLVKDASSKMVDIPAVYETVTEKILVTPARTYWKKGSGLIEKVDGNTGEIMCLVKEPAVYKTVSKRVLKTPASTKETIIPAEFKTVKKQVVKTPATTRTEIIPAKYETVRVLKQVSSPYEKRIPIAAEYGSVTKREMVEPSRMEWRRVLCETNMTQTNILELQKALKAKGFNPGPLDGVYGRETLTAVNAFQVSQNLPKGGLTYGTIKALGLNLTGQ